MMDEVGDGLGAPEVRAAVWTGDRLGEGRKRRIRHARRACQDAVLAMIGVIHHLGALLERSAAVEAAARPAPPEELAPPS